MKYLRGKKILTGIMNKTFNRRPTLQNLGHSGVETNDKNDSWQITVL